jgi:hypothetical protein
LELKIFKVALVRQYDGAVRKFLRQGELLVNKKALEGEIYDVQKQMGMAWAKKYLTESERGSDSSDDEGDLAKMKAAMLKQAKEQLKSTGTLKLRILGLKHAKRQT